MTRGRELLIGCTLTAIGLLLLSYSIIGLYIHFTN